MTRTANPRVVPLFVDRWSPRAFDESAMPAEDLAVILEAATWAPSAYNYQPWKFLYARRGTADWQRFLDLLIPFNASWAKDAAVLIFILSEKDMQQGDTSAPNHSHSFDAGAAWAQMALQAHALGWHAHGMSGVQFDKAQAELGVPEGWRIEAAVAIGKKDSPDRLPEGLREREVPSTRKPLAEVAHEGGFPA